MSIENYVNTGSMDPYGSWRPDGGLSGWMYQDKVGDYNKARDIQNDAGVLANLQQRQSTDEFSANAPVRDASRQLKLGEIGQAQQLQPGDTQLKMGAQQGDLAAQPYQNTMKVWQAAAALPAAQRDAKLKEMTTAGSILKGMPTDADPQSRIDMLRNSGVDTTRWDGKPPEQVSKELDFIKNLDPDVFKHQREIELQQERNKGTKDVATITAQSRIGVANIKRDAVLAGLKEGKWNEQSLFREYARIGAIDDGERTVTEQSFYDHYPEYRSAAAQYKSDQTSTVPAKSIENIKNSVGKEKRLRDSFNTDQSLKGYKPGQFNPGKGLEVLDAQGKVKGWINQ